MHVCVTVALMKIFLGVSLCLLVFSQEDGWPGDQSGLHAASICHRAADTGSTQLLHLDDL